MKSWVRMIALAVVTFVMGAAFAFLGGWQIECYQAMQATLENAPANKVHMMYAMQWFALAIGLMLAFLIFANRQRRKVVSRRHSA